MVLFVRDVSRQARGLPRFLELPQLEQSGRRADVRGRLLWLERDVMLVRVDGKVEAIEARREDGELTPDVGHLRLFTQDLLQQRDRLRPLPLAREIDRRAVPLQDFPLVLGIGQRAARLRRDVCLSADVAQRLQTLARLRGDGGRRLNRRAGGHAIERASQRLPRLRPLLGDVGPLVRIVRQVVQLFSRRLDVSEALVGQCGQLAPAEVIARV